MSNFIFGVFINHTAKQFSTTARQEGNSNLPAMEASEKAQGFDFVVLAKGLTKSQADAFKAIQIAAYENIGYTKVSRQAVY